MKNESVTISSEGVHRLEYAVDYMLDNIITINDVCCDMCDELCKCENDTIHKETQCLNVLKILESHRKFNGLIYSMGDMLKDMCILLKSVAGEIQSKNGSETEGR